MNSTGKARSGLQLTPTSIAGPAQPSTERTPLARIDRSCLRFDKSNRVPDGVTFDIRRFNHRAALNRHSTLSSNHHSIAKLVSMLP